MGKNKRQPGEHGRTGLRWFEDPRGDTWLRHGRHWPRDNAIIRGRVITVSSKIQSPHHSHRQNQNHHNHTKKWLLATHIQQPAAAAGNGKSTKPKKWHKAPKGAALPLQFGHLYHLVPVQKQCIKQKAATKLSQE